MVKWTNISNHPVIAYLPLLADGKGHESGGVASQEIATAGFAGRGPGIPFLQTLLVIRQWKYGGGIRM